MNTHLARSTDPWTSHAAAAKVHKFAGTHQARIIQALKKHGPMTCDEIAGVTGLYAHQVNKRMPEAERAGLVRLTGKTRLSWAGVSERVWKA